MFGVIVKIPESQPSHSIRHRIIHVSEYYLPDLIHTQSPSVPQRHGIPLERPPRHALPYIARAFRVLAPAPPLPPPIAPTRLVTILKGPLRVLPNPALLLLLSFILSSA